MNTNGNTYTVIYSTILVVLVAAILAFAALSLQDKQNENVKLETVSKLLGAASQADGTFTIEEGADVLGLYADHITDAFYVDGNGNRVGEMNMGKEDKNAIEVTTTSDLKKQNDIMKKIDAGLCFRHQRSKNNGDSLLRSRPLGTYLGLYCIERRRKDHHRCGFRP